MKPCALLFGVMLLFSCKERVSNLQQTAAGGSGSARVAEPTAAPPPLRTPGKWNAKEIEEIAKISFDGFTNNPMTINADGATIRQYGNPRPKTYATVRINPCLDCLPMELAKWKEKESALKAVTLSENLLKLPDTEYALGDAEIAGKKMISAYQLGYGNNSYSHAVTLYYNDGVNEISVIAQYADNMTVDRITMTKLVSRETLEDTAAMMMATYLRKM
jgi:hypothetical protein